MKQIFGKGACIALCVCAVMNFSSCGEAVLDETFSVERNDGGSRLTLSTRGEGDSGENTLLESRCYFFNEAGRCVHIMTTNEEENTFTVLLAAGTYTVLHSSHTGRRYGPQCHFVARGAGDGRPADEAEDTHRCEWGGSERNDHAGTKGHQDQQH